MGVEPGDLALALAQVATYIQETPETLATYLELFRDYKLDLLEDVELFEDYLKTVAKTWDISLRAAQEDWSGSRDLMKPLAFLAPDAIPISMMEGRYQI